MTEENEKTYYTRVPGKKGAITRTQEICVHLMRFNDPMIGVYDGHYDMTQNGIARAIGWRRDAVSLELRKMTDLVEMNHRHVKGSARIRETFTLTPDGFRCAEAALDQLEKLGYARRLPPVSPDTLRQDPPEIYLNRGIAYAEEALELLRARRTAKTSQAIGKLAEAIISLNLSLNRE